MLGFLSPSARQRVSEILDEVAHYIQERLPHWQKGRVSDLRSWLLWHFCWNLVALRRDRDSGAITAVVVVRHLERPQQYEAQYFHRPGAKICCAELAVADDPRALWAAIEALRARHGTPQQIAFARGGRSARLRLYSWEIFGNKLKAQHELPQYS
jgi:hypothetical protein